MSGSSSGGGLGSVLSSGGVESLLLLTAIALLVLSACCCLCFCAVSMMHLLGVSKDGMQLLGASKEAGVAGVHELLRVGGLPPPPHDRAAKMYGGGAYDPNDHRYDA